MEEGTVVRWLREDGETVEPGDELVEIETDKATMVYEAEAAGVLRRLVQEGETVRLGAPLAELLPSGAFAAVAPARDVLTATAAPAVSSDDDGERIAASPVARRLAASRGLDLAGLAPGSGPNGRIVKRDVENAADASAEASPAAPEVPSPVAVGPSVDQPGTETPGAMRISDRIELTRLQAIVARRMTESRATVPDFSVEVDVDADGLVELQADLRERLPDGPRPSYNDFVIKACALALRSHPRVNGAYRDGHIELHDRVNVGLAVAAEGALLVPVVADADIKSVGAIATETRRLVERARTGALTPPDVGGGTFTVSNLGMFGVARFTAVVNPPQAAILAVGALAQRPVVRDGDVRPGHVMTLTLCVDHRVLFGVDAAAFLAEVRASLEQPMRLLV
jgi:pyruvate dehydrogenase E2 component (dihydrolipoamide acetyltransferase)